MHLPGTVHYPTPPHPTQDVSDYNPCNFFFLVLSIITSWFYPPLSFTFPTPLVRFYYTEYQRIPALLYCIPPSKKKKTYHIFLHARLLFTYGSGVSEGKMNCLVSFLAKNIVRDVSHLC